MTYVPRSPLGFKNLLSWKQAGEILSLTKTFVASLPGIHPKTHQLLTRLRDHMIDSARSIQRNIEEGYKRATTAEYIKFLGFSRGSLEELIGDFKDCQRDGIGNQRAFEKMLRENKLKRLPDGRIVPDDSP